MSGVPPFQSGAPYTVSVPTDIARIGAGSARASVIGNPNLSGGARTPAHWFATEAFLNPALMTAGVFGTAGHDILIGPGFQQWDLSLLKNCRVGEAMNLQFSAGSVNVFNHTKFTGIHTNVQFVYSGLSSG